MKAENRRLFVAMCVVGMLLAFLVVDFGVYKLFNPIDRVQVRQFMPDGTLAAAGYAYTRCENSVFYFIIGTGTVLCIAFVILAILFYKKRVA